ncbi:hypothetical protein K504DRAFT_472070 [Pleomassaria siparia CBS 279.74]|uniref:MFS general substrate transporter n=1 Tax=Pleomassaria siparia CBS 279.74 TaxID=1314801 RepID=A0A6G1JWU4_9PLEO|nr:hypothetical protein K504DRAFT_472070 [Pleomassaria siparia CBS 279.74]
MDKADTVDHIEHYSASDSEKAVSQPAYPVNEEDYEVTFKTWVVVTILASAYGISFWIVPAIAVIATPSTSLYTICNAIAFMICGANSDLFGRRWFLIVGNALLLVGHLMWRHISITIADLGAWIAVVVGPIAARYAIAGNPGTWRWLFHAPTIGAALGVLCLYLLYFPPKHRRGLPFGEALKELDYVGAALFILSGTLIFIGILYTQIISSSSPKVIGLLDMGREFTAPFVVGFVVTMFYVDTSNTLHVTNIVYPTQCAVLFLKETSTIKDSVLLTLPSNIGLVFCRKGMMMVFIFVSQMGFGWAQMLSITFIQFGVPQVELGVSGGLAGVNRFVYTTTLSKHPFHIHAPPNPRYRPPPRSPLIIHPRPPRRTAPRLRRLDESPRYLSPAIAAAAGSVLQPAYVHALRTTALSSMSFDIVAIIACVACNDIGKKMKSKIEVFLENDEFRMRRKRSPTHV